MVGGKYKVWTKRLGSGKTKELLLHGGPAMTHGYLEAMESFLPDAGIEMYSYDQLGCGNSDISEDTSLWTLERYTEEVEEVRRGWAWRTLCSMASRGAACWRLSMRSGASGANNFSRQSEVLEKDWSTQEGQRSR